MTPPSDHVVPARDVPCTDCRARATRPCIGLPAGVYHPARIDASWDATQKAIIAADLRTETPQ